VPLKARDVKGKLQKKFGFAPPAKGRGSGHEWLARDVPGAGRIPVMFSHSDGELGDRLLTLICKQLKVARPFLNGMISCTNDLDAYVRKVLETLQGRL